MCYKCREVWHPRQTCDQATDKSYMTWSKKHKNVDNCPKCDMRIEKVAGCNHMTCLYCHYEFCWICKGEAYEGSGHFDPYSWNGCGAEMLDSELNPKDYAKIRQKRRSRICCLIFLSPILLLFFTPYLITLYFMDKTDKRCSDWLRIPLIPIIFILSIPLAVIGIPITLVYYAYKLISYCVKFHCRPS